MAQAGKTTLQFPVANTIYDANDRLVFIYAASTANSVPSSAQTATISVSNFLSSIDPILLVETQQADPANSTANAIVSQGQIFFSNTYGYVAIANGITRRFAIASF